MPATAERIIGRYTAAPLHHAVMLIVYLARRCASGPKESVVVMAEYRGQLVVVSLDRVVHIG
jgi:hypothetical protein